MNLIILNVSLKSDIYKLIMTIKYLDGSGSLSLTPCVTNCSARDLISFESLNLIRQWPVNGFCKQIATYTWVIKLKDLLAGKFENLTILKKFSTKFRNKRDDIRLRNEREGLEATRGKMTYFFESPMTLISWFCSPHGETTSIFQRGLEIIGLDYWLLLRILPPKNPYSHSFYHSADK